MNVANKPYRNKNNTILVKVTCVRRTEMLTLFTVV